MYSTWYKLCFYRVKIRHKKGIINIGGKAQSVYDFAKKFNKDIKGIKLKITNRNNLSKNVSMNINKMKKIINA